MILFLFLELIKTLPVGRLALQNIIFQMLIKANWLENVIKKLKKGKKKVKKKEATRRFHRFLIKNKTPAHFVLSEQAPNSQNLPNIILLKLHFSRHLISKLTV